MNTPMSRRDYIIWACLFLLLIVGLIFVAMTVENANGQHTTISTCDDSLWQHVYNRQRLHVQQSCVTVVGTTMDATNGKNKDGCRHEKDGDGHCFLFLSDAALQGKYLNEKNVTNEDGMLVFEPMCRYRVTQTDALAVCRGWSQKLTLPPVGSHVRAVGVWVLDSEHGHMELHPITSLTVIE